MRKSFREMFTRSLGVHPAVWLSVWIRRQSAEALYQLQQGTINGRVSIDRVLCWWCREYHHPAEVQLCMALERPQPVEASASTLSSTAKMPSWLQQFPELWEFLSKPSYKDGAPRQTGKITLQLVSEGIQVSLTDPSSSAYCCRRFKSLDDALVELELALESGMISWRPSGPPKGKKGR